MDVKQLNPPVAENMMRIISETGVKQLAVAKRIGRTPQEFSDMMCGRRIIKVNDIPKISAALNVSIDMLFKQREA